MKQFVALGILLWLLPLTVPRALAEDAPDKAMVLALENAWNLAEAHKDARAMGELMSDTLIFIDYDGALLDKGQFLARLKERPQQDEKLVTESMSVRLFGPTAIVLGLYRESGLSKGKPYVRRGRFIDTWQQENGVWKCIASQATLISKG